MTRAVVSLLIVSVVIFALCTSSHGSGIPVTRWVSPDNSRPITRAEWIAGRSIRTDPQIKIVPGFTGLATDFLIVVNTDLYPLISSDLTGYISNLQNDGFSPSVITCDDVQSLDACDSLKSILAFYHLDGLQGAVFIGDLPIAWFHMLDDFDGDSVFEGYEEFPCDLYYMDLNGEWLDTLRWDWTDSLFLPGSDSILDVHRGEVIPEIWVGRLTPSPIGDEDSLLHEYFVRDSIYRCDSFPIPIRALAFVDDDWEWWAGEWSDNIRLTYPNVTTVADRESTIADNYRDELSTGYEWISVFAHSWPGGHGFKYGMNQWSWFYAYEVPIVEPDASFYNLFACSNARFVENGYMGGMYVFGREYGLGALGTTKTGSMLNFDEFYYPLGKGATIGEAFKDWFLTRGLDGYETWESSWFYGMTLLGDPTLKVRSAVGIEAEIHEVRSSPVMSLKAHPNPFKGVTTIHYILGGRNTENAELSIYNAAGRAVKFIGLSSAKEYVSWDGKSNAGECLPSGVYFCRLQSDGETLTNNLILIR